MSYFILKSRKIKAVAPSLPTEHPVSVGGGVLSPAKPEKPYGHVPLPREILRDMSFGKTKPIVNARKEMDKLSASLDSSAYSVSKFYQTHSSVREIIEQIKESAESDIDLREIIKLVTGEGFRWLALRQVDRDLPCPCVKDTIPAGSCVRCLGTGFPFTDHLVKGYLWNKSSGVEFYTDIGRVSTSVRNLVVEHDRPIRKFDQILEISLDPTTGEPSQPFEILRSYVLSDVMPLRGKGGRVEFWKATAEERSISDDTRGEGGTNYNYGSNR